MVVDVATDVETVEVITIQDIKRVRPRLKVTINQSLPIHLIHHIAVMARNGIKALEVGTMRLGLVFIKINNRRRVRV
jgi:hypothetical protein